MKKRWVINTPPEATKIEELSKKLNCHPVIANLLLQRGITSSEQAQSFFYPSLNMLHDPFLMKDMDKAVERLDRAIAQDEKNTDIRRLRCRWDDGSIPAIQVFETPL